VEESEFTSFRLNCVREDVTDEYLGAATKMGVAGRLGAYRTTTWISSACFQEYTVI
jgi:hypothetical protein